MEIVNIAEVDARAMATTRTGHTPRQFLLAGETSDGMSFRIVRSQYLPGDAAFTTPRHSHPFQQIRWAETGSLNYAPEREIAAGDIVYFPRDAYYGPQHRDDGIGVTLQFGFGDELIGGKDGIRVHEEGVKALLQEGRIEESMFIDIDPETGAERRRYAPEVIAERFTAKKFEKKPAGYEHPIMMRTQAFPYFPAGDGVELKLLGRFFDHAGPEADTRMSMVRLAPNARHSFDADRTQVAWTLGDGLAVDGKRHLKGTYIHVPVGEQLDFGAAEQVELIVIELPRR